MQRAVFRADHVVEIFIVNIRPPGMAVLLGFRAGVAGGQSAAALKNTLADPGRFVGAVRYNGLMFGIVFTQFVIQRVKRYAVMHVAGGDMDAENKIVLVTGGMRFIRKTLFVFALVENAALRVGCGYHRFFLFGRLFVAVVRKGLFPCSSRSLFTSSNSSLAYRFASFGTAFLACFFRFALALICVPSTNIASVSR